MGIVNNLHSKGILGSFLLTFWTVWETCPGLLWLAAGHVDSSVSP